MTSIGDYAFDGCSKLTSIVIPESVTKIGMFSFYGCSNLKTITIPASITSIGFDAFDNCPSLTDVYYGGNNDDRKKISISGNYDLTNITWHYNYKSN